MRHCCIRDIAPLPIEVYLFIFPLLVPADYHLLVYGSLTFDASYVGRCRALVAELGLEGNVELRGLGKPTDVLAKGWCYLQVRTSFSFPFSSP